MKQLFTKALALAGLCTLPFGAWAQDESTSTTTTTSTTYTSYKVLSIGVRGGIGFSEFRYSRRSSNTTTESYPGNSIIVPHAGLFMEGRPSQVLGIIGGLSYRQRGYRVNRSLLTAESPLAPYNYEETDRLHYVSLDGLVRLYLIGNPSISPYIGGGLRGDLLMYSTVKASAHGDRGPVMDENRRRETEYLDDFNRFNLSGVVNVGLKLGPVFVEVEWNPDITPAYYRSTSFGSESFRNNAYYVNLGLQF